MDMIYKCLSCECGSFEPAKTNFNQCAQCGEIIPFFRCLREHNAITDWLSASADNPTNPDLIWGTERQVNTGFRKRIEAVRNIVLSTGVQAGIGADLSGGAGRWLSGLAPLFEIFFHMDISKKALHYACSKHESYSNIVYLQNDLLREDQKIKNVDCAFCLDTLLYSGNFVNVALEAAKKTLSTRGILIVELCSKYHNELGRMIKFRKRNAVDQNYTIQQARKILCEHGFKIEKEIFVFKEFFSPLPNPFNRPPVWDVFMNFSTWFYFAASKK